MATYVSFGCVCCGGSFEAVPNAAGQPLYSGNRALKHPRCGPCRRFCFLASTPTGVQIEHRGPTLAPSEAVDARR